MKLSDNINQRIVVIDLLYLGDLIFAVPFFCELRKNFPKARIDLVVNSAVYPIIEDNANFNNIYAYNKKWTLRQSIEFAGRLRQNNYDLGINIHGSWRSAILLKLIRPSFSIGYGGQGRGIFLNRELKRPENQHMVEVYLNVLRKMNLKVEPRLPFLEIRESAQNKIDNMLSDWGLNSNQKLIALNTGGSWLSKRWTAEGFARLGDVLNRKYGKVLFVGGPDDLPLVAKIINLMKTKPLVATGKTDLPELAALLSRCDLVISNDSGPVHVAAAVGTPTVTIFGPSDDVKYRPLGEKHRVVKTEIDCRPCGKHQCPLGHHRCMTEITVDQILKEMETLL